MGAPVGPVPCRAPRLGRQPAAAGRASRAAALRPHPPSSPRAGGWGHECCGADESYMWLKHFLCQTVFQREVKRLTGGSRAFTRTCLQFVGSSSDEAWFDILRRSRSISIDFSRFTGWIFQWGQPTESYLCEKADEISVVQRCFYFCLACSDDFFKARKMSLSLPTADMISYMEEQLLIQCKKNGISLR